MPDIQYLRYLVARHEGGSFASSSPSWRRSLLHKHQDSAGLPSQGKYDAQARSVDYGQNAAFQLGLPKIDSHIGFLPRAALHEVISAPQSLATACGFACGVLKQAMEAQRPLIWLEDTATADEYGTLYPTTFSFFGLDAQRLITINCSSSTEALKAGEDCLKSHTAGGIVLCLSAPARPLDFTATRRLHLAAQRAAIPVLLVVSSHLLKTSCAFTRWKIGSAPSLPSAASAPGLPTFDVELMRNRCGGIGHWLLEWNPNEYKFSEQAIPKKALSCSGFSAFSHRPINQNIA